MSTYAQLYEAAYPQGKHLGRPTKTANKQTTVGTSLTASEIEQVDASATVGSRSAKVRALILKGLKS
jgi:hypothetical protein